MCEHGGWCISGQWENSTRKWCDLCSCKPWVVVPWPAGEKHTENCQRNSTHCGPMQSSTKRDWPHSLVSLGTNVTGSMSEDTPAPWYSSFPSWFLWHKAFKLIVVGSLGHVFSLMTVACHTDTTCLDRKMIPEDFRLSMGNCSVWFERIVINMKEEMLLFQILSFKTFFLLNFFLFFYFFTIWGFYFTI